MTRLGCTLAFALATLVGCDQSLSQWDRVSITVVSGKTATYQQGAPVVDAGADVVTNAAFEREALVDGAPAVAFQWESATGGELSFGSPQEAVTSIVAAEDGTYTVRVTARSQTGEEGSDEFQLVWDATGPVPTANLQTLAGSASGPDVRVTNQTTIVLSWGQATDQIVGLRDYTLTWYDAAACAGQATVVTGLTDTVYAVTGSHGDAFSFRVTAIDELGQATNSDCSPSIRIDTQAPPALAALTGATGSKLGEVALTLDLPADYSDYAELTLRRAAGAVAPADCSSGTAVKTLTAAQLTSDPLLVADPTGSAGGTFSYRVCIQDAAGNQTGTDSVANKDAKHHYIFASSVTNLKGALGGLAGADATCQTLAQNSALAVINSDPTWRAILSTSTVHAKDHIQVSGKVTAFDGFTETLIANDASDLWDNGIQSAVGTDETGAAIISDSVWTGTTSSGTAAANTCNDWTNNTAGVSGAVGDAGDFTGGWLDVAAPETCDTDNRIYCISQF